MSKKTTLFLLKQFSVVLLVIIAATLKSAAVTYYMKTGTSLAANTLANWTTDPAGGTGTAPANFTTAGDIFHVRNATTPTLTAAWTVTGSIVVGNGSTAITFTTSTFAISCSDITIATNATMTAGGVITGTLNKNATSTLNYNVTTNPTFGTLNATSTINMGGTSVAHTPMYSA